MKYLQTFEQKLNNLPPHMEMDSIEDPTDLSGETEIIEEPSDDSEDQGIIATSWNPEMSGNGDYSINFKNAAGADVVAVFKDTGNRKPQGDMMFAAFKGMAGKSSDGKQYHAEATMKKVSEGEFEIQSFAIYEF